MVPPSHGWLEVMREIKGSGSSSVDGGDNGGSGKGNFSSALVSERELCLSFSF
jgi:hypothetical protein